ncbi:MAG: O-sialoglycoprotein endopeptidase, partial [Acidaminobacteraceae bacterium]
DDELKLTIIGGTKDLSFGQLVDRIGVNLGLDFPCGAQMDILSSSTTRKAPKVKTDGYFNISGMENYFKNIDDLLDGEVYYLLFSTISNILLDSITYLGNKYKVDEVILVGGVSSNSIIKDQLSSKLKANGIKCHVADSDYCKDNAIGSAYYSLIKSNKL